MGAEQRNNPTSQWMKTHQGSVNKGEIYDQFARPVGIGDMVCLGNHPGEIFRVSVIKPVLRPDAPPGVVEVQLVQVVVQGMQGGVPVMGLVKVRDATEYLTEEQLAEFKAEMDPSRPAGGLVIP